MNWNWLKKIGKGTVKAAPEILDGASLVMPGILAGVVQKGADAIREHRKEEAEDEGASKDKK